MASLSPNHSQNKVFGKYHWCIAVRGFRQSVHSKICWHGREKIKYEISTTSGSLLIFFHKISRMYEGLEFDLLIEPNPFEKERFYVKSGKVVPMESDSF